LWQGTGYDAHRGGQVRVHLKDEAARPWLSSLVTVDLRVTNERFIGSVLQGLSSTFMISSAARPLQGARAVAVASLSMQANEQASREKQANGEQAPYCEQTYTHDPPEDPSVACWVVSDDDSEKLEYVCVPEHPCLDIQDGADHTEDSY